MLRTNRDAAVNLGWESLQVAELARRWRETAAAAARTIPTGEADCKACCDIKSVIRFTLSALPLFATTQTCTHRPAACLECIAASIRLNMNTQLWNNIDCPECGTGLGSGQT